MKYKFFCGIPQARENWKKLFARSVRECGIAKQGCGVNKWFAGARYECPRFKSWPGTLRGTLSYSGEGNREVLPTTTNLFQIIVFVFVLKQYKKLKLKKTIIFLMFSRALMEKVRLHQPQQKSHSSSQQGLFILYLYFSCSLSSFQLFLPPHSMNRFLSPLPYFPLITEFTLPLVISSACYSIRLSFPSSRTCCYSIFLCSPSLALFCYFYLNFSSLFHIFCLIVNLLAAPV
jgi:hypothetical protein